MPNIYGYIGFFGLEKWWLSTFSESERDYIEEVYQPLGAEGTLQLTHGKITFWTGRPKNILYALAGWFKKDSDRYLAYRILDRAAVEEGSTLDRHFFYQQLAKTSWSDRHQRDDARDICIRACDQQIAMSKEAAAAWLAEYPGDELPRHYGYTQRAHIHQIDGEFDEAIALVRRGQLEGWRSIGDDEMLRGARDSVHSRQSSRTGDRHRRSRPPRRHLTGPHSPDRNLRTPPLRPRPRHHRSTHRQRLYHPLGAARTRCRTRLGHNRSLAR